MNTILNIGEKGASFMDVVAPTPSVAIEGVQRFTPIVGSFPTLNIESEVNDGTKRSIEVHQLLLSHPQVFGLVWEMAVYEPIVYAQQGSRMVMGILSPNFDEYGIVRLSGLKVLPLKTPYPLISKGTDLLPNSDMATMLAGSAHAEGKGSGGHERPPEQDYEHKLTYVGAASLGRKTIILNGQHMQHAERLKTSVATGLTNGSLGNIFAEGSDKMGGFTGYDMPIHFQLGMIQPTDTIFFPKGFLNNQEAYGVYYDDASRIAYGAALQIMHQRHGQSVVSERLRQIARSA